MSTNNFGDKIIFRVTYYYYEILTIKLQKITVKRTYEISHALHGSLTLVLY